MAKTFKSILQQSGFEQNPETKVWEYTLTGGVVEAVALQGKAWTYNGARSETKAGVGTTSLQSHLDATSP